MVGRRRYGGLPFPIAEDREVVVDLLAQRRDAAQA